MTSDLPETPHDSVDRFAADLRRLRVDAGTPTYDRLRSETGISKSVLTEAFAGRSLPSARTVDAIVRTCNGSTDDWLARRDALSKGRAVTAPEPTGSDTPAPLWRRRSALWLALGSFLVGAIASGAAVALIMGQLTTTPLPQASAPSTTGATARITVTSGDDPGDTECTKDAKVAASETRVDNSLLEIIWSSACQAGWGRITRYDGLAAGNTVTIAIYPETAPNGTDRQQATEHDVQGAYTNLVVRPSKDTRLCAEASFTVKGKEYSLGAPICT